MCVYVSVVTGIQNMYKLRKRGCLYKVVLKFAA